MLSCGKGGLLRSSLLILHGRPIIRNMLIISIKIKVLIDNTSLNLIWSSKSILEVSLIWLFSETLISKRGKMTYGDVWANRVDLSELALKDWANLRFPHLRAKKVVDKHFHLVKSRDGVHDILISAVHGIFVRLHIQPVHCFVLAEPSKKRQMGTKVRLLEQLSSLILLTLESQSVQLGFILVN